MLTIFSLAIIPGSSHPALCKTTALELRCGPMGSDQRCFSVPLCPPVPCTAALGRVACPRPWQHLESITGHRRWGFCSLQSWSCDHSFARLVAVHLFSVGQRTQWKVVETKLWRLVLPSERKTYFPALSATNAALESCWPMKCKAKCSQGFMKKRYFSDTVLPVFLFSSLEIRKSLLIKKITLRLSKEPF